MADTIWLDAEKDIQQQCGGVDPILIDRKFLQAMLVTFANEQIADANAELVARLAEAEAVIGHYGDLSHWKHRYSTSIASRVYCTGIDNDPTNGYDKAREYFKHSGEKMEVEDESTRTNND